MATFRSLLLARREFCKFFTAGSRSLNTTAALTNWNKDWKPGPYPLTPEERARAAKKYGLRVEDYEPYDDDGTGHGDYPKLPYVSGDSKSYYEDWDMPEVKRNYGEPLHVDYDAIGEDRWNPNATPRYSYGYMFASLSAFLGVYFAVYMYFGQYPLVIPTMPKQYPFNDLYLENGGDPDKESEIKHYTFEPPE